MCDWAIQCINLLSGGTLLTHMTYKLDNLPHNYQHIRAPDTSRCVPPPPPPFNPSQLIPPPSSVVHSSLTTACPLSY